jgi:NAD(P)H dehydrogenase (quinone)
MRVLVIYCHPVTESFAAVAHTVALEALRHAGHAAIDVDLYADAFGPVMSRQERLDCGFR